MGFCKPTRGGKGATRNAIGRRRFYIETKSSNPGPGETGAFRQAASLSTTTQPLPNSRCATSVVNRSNEHFHDRADKQLSGFCHFPPGAGSRRLPIVLSRRRFCVLQGTAQAFGQS